LKISQVFASEFLQAADLQGRSWPVEMLAVSPRVLRGKRKLVLTFRGGKKGLILNATNARAIAKLHGDETEAWPGKRIAIYPTTCDSPEGIVDCIRIAAAPAPANVERPTSNFQLPTSNVQLPTDDAPAPEEPPQ
jgi:hypothetical protein